MIEDLQPLTGLMLSQSAVDRATALRSDRAWIQARWRDRESRVLPVAGGRVPIRQAGAPPRTTLAWVAPQAAPEGDSYFLGRDGAGIAHFAVHHDQTVADLESNDLRTLAAVLPPDDVALMVHAVALDNWHSAHQFCPRCGSPTEVASGGAERRCVADGSAHFPRTDPAVIVLVIDPEDRALLGRQASWPKGRFSTLAGFVEPGESAEQAVVREISEESSVVASDIRYLGSQPWPFPASLMLGFVAQSDAVEPVADGQELEQVRWFSRGELATGIEAGDVVPPGGISIARRLVERWFGSPLPSGPPESAWR